MSIGTGPNSTPLHNNYFTSPIVQTPMDTIAIERHRVILTDSAPFIARFDLNRHLFAHRVLAAETNR